MIGAGLSQLSSSTHPAGHLGAAVVQIGVGATVVGGLGVVIISEQASAGETQRSGFARLGIIPSGHSHRGSQAIVHTRSPQVSSQTQ